MVGGRGRGAYSFVTCLGRLTIDMIREDKGEREGGGGVCMRVPRCKLMYRVENLARM